MREGGIEKVEERVGQVFHCGLQRDEMMGFRGHRGEGFVQKR